MTWHRNMLTRQLSDFRAAQRLTVDVNVHGRANSESGHVVWPLLSSFKTLETGMSGPLINIGHSEEFTL